MKNRKLLVAMALACASVASTAGYAADKVSIVVSPLYAFMKSTNDEIVRRFNEANPDIEIVLQAPARNGGDQIQRTILDAATGKSPDIAMHSADLFGQIVDRNLAQPIDDLIAAEGDWEAKGYSERFINLAEHKGKIWGLPYASGTTIIFYNADMVREAGGDPDNFPTTWPEITALARKITDLGNQRIGMYFDYAADGNVTFQTLIGLNGGSLVTPEGGIGFNGPEGLAALKTLHDIGESGMVDMQREQARQAFGAGTLGMYVGAGSQLGILKEASAKRFEIRTIPLPHAAPNAHIPVGGSLVVMMTTDPKKQAAAWEYMKFAAGPIGQTIVVEKTGNMSSNDLAVKDDSLLGKFYRENPDYKAVADMAPIVSRWVSFPGSNSLKIADVIREHLRRVITLQVQPDEAMANMTRDVQALLP
jgi:multiple sugar transport system substrate-binding protein